jgi:thiamine transport system substrate-binding protein
VRTRGFLLVLVALAAACGDDDAGPDTGAPVTASSVAPTASTASAPSASTTAAPNSSPAPSGPSVTLLAYDSFPPSDTSLNEALDRFTADTGIGVELAIGGDAGALVSKAVLTAGNPEGDVIFGVDNTFLSRAVDGGVFEPYEAAGLDAVPDELLALVPGHEATPVDYGDVCINEDIGWFADHDLDPPADLAALAEPAYRDLLVVENPATSSPGLAFVLASIAEFGDSDWVDYWARLRSNGVAVVDSWTEAYYERFTWAGGGDRPLVVSYGTSPPAEVIFADPPVDEPPTAAIESTCFRQVEFAGVLAGTDQPEAARRLVDFLVSPPFQAELPLNLFVFPANSDAELPAEFTATAIRAADPYELAPADIAAGREDWIETWTDTVLR